MNTKIIPFLILLSVSISCTPTKEDISPPVPEKEVIIEDIEEEISEEEMAILPPADGEAVMEYLEQEFYSHSWTPLILKTTTHGAHLNGYINTPDNTIIVIDNHLNEDTITNTFVMYHKAGYNPEAGDWFWLEYDAEGSIEQEGKVKECISCHSTADNWLFSD